jgi:nucleoside-diphosphate-sugar epimerase
MTTRPKIAIIGANGFVGSRAVELFHLNGWAEVVPVVRGINSLARLSRFELGWKLADATNPDDLAKALSGCEALVHAIVGDPDIIEASARALIPAARAAGVKRVVYLSSASVHGQNPTPGTTEETALSDRQEIAYNNAKVRAEQIIAESARGSSVELITLRPSIVFGPRDRWITTLVQDLELGRAWLLKGGEGVCNTIYVDNLVHAIRLGFTCGTEAIGQAYLVGDRERITWAELYHSVATRLGIDPTTIQSLESPSFPKPSVAARLDGIRSSKAAQKVIARVPTILKSVAKGAVKGLKPSPMPNPWFLPNTAGPNPTLEMARLQECTYQLPWSKAHRLLGYEPVETFQTGLDRSLAWLEWAKS